MAASPAELEAQFQDLEHQHMTATAGMWVFLGTEVMFFGGMFLAYTAYRSMYFPEFHAGSNRLDLNSAVAMTAVLITSSFSMALAVHYAQARNFRRAILFMLLTALLGSAFVGIHIHDYIKEIGDGLGPGAHFSYQSPDVNKIDPSRVELFFVLYFTMSALHTLHVFIGVCVMAVLAFLLKLGRARPIQIEIAGLYWGFVDIVWMFLFPLMYLVGPRS